MTSVLFGSMPIAVIKCSHCKSIWEWSSQPKLRGFAACDILRHNRDIVPTGAIPRVVHLKTLIYV